MGSVQSSRSSPIAHLNQLVYCEITEPALKTQDTELVPQPRLPFNGVIILCSLCVPASSIEMQKKRGRGQERGLSSYFLFQLRTKISILGPFPISRITKPRLPTAETECQLPGKIRSITRKRLKSTIEHIKKPSQCMSQKIKSKKTNPTQSSNVS